MKKKQTSTRKKDSPQSGKTPNQLLKEALQKKKGKARLSAAIRTEYNGRSFQSKHEAKYAAKLDVLRFADDPKERVVKVTYQKPYELYMNGVMICKYLADFFVEYADGHTDIIDAKGFRTEIYKLKKKMMEASLGIKIREV